MLAPDLVVLSEHSRPDGNCSFVATVYNLNRQFVFLNDIDQNKATVHARRIKELNPEANVQVWSEGLTENNVFDFVSDCDFVFDAIDVTTAADYSARNSKEVKPT